MLSGAPGRLRAPTLYVGIQGARGRGSRASRLAAAVAQSNRRPLAAASAAPQETFNAAHETERKRALSAIFAQTKQQERKDAEILAEAKRTMESRAASKNMEEGEAPTSFNNAAVPADGVSPLSNSHPSSTAAHTAAAANTSIPDSLQLLKVYLRTHALDQMVQQVTAPAGIRMIPSKCH